MSHYCRSLSGFKHTHNGVQPLKFVMSIDRICPCIALWNRVVYIRSWLIDLRALQFMINFSHISLLNSVGSIWSFSEWLCVCLNLMAIVIVIILLVTIIVIVLVIINVPGCNGGCVAGIVIGIIVALLLLLVVLFFVWRWKHPAPKYVPELLLVVNFVTRSHDAGSLAHG